MRTGYRLAIGVAAVTIVLAIVLFVAEAARTTRDASRYGQVPLPGRESVNLPAGEVLIYYGERTEIEPDCFPPRPTEPETSGSNHEWPGAARLHSVLVRTI